MTLPEPAPVAEFSPPIQLLAVLWNLWQSLASAGAGRLRQECGLDLKGFIALSYLQARPYQSAELARAMQMPRYEVSRLLGELEAQGHVQRLRQQHDGRQVQVTLTAAGQTAWQAGIRTVEAVTEPYLAQLSAAERETLLGTLLRLTVSDDV